MEKTMANDRQATCEQRIGAVMESREQYIAGLQKIIDGQATSFDDEDQARARLDELPLSVQIERVLRIDLSTGGPADYITAKLSRESYGWAVTSATYHYADWFDHAERPIDEGSALWRMAEYYADLGVIDEE